jgi:hypothetical protein
VTAFIYTLFYPRSVAGTRNREVVSVRCYIRLFNMINFSRSQHRIKCPNMEIKGIQGPTNMDVM